MAGLILNLLLLFKGIRVSLHLNSWFFYKKVERLPRQSNDIREFRISTLLIGGNFHFLLFFRILRHRIFFIDLVFESSMLTFFFRCFEETNHQKARGSPSKGKKKTYCLDAIKYYIQVIRA